MRRNATRQRPASPKPIATRLFAARLVPGIVALLVFALAGAIGKASPSKQAALIGGSRMIYQWPVSVKEEIYAALPNARPVLMEVTAYCPCAKCCGKDAHGVTASGRHVTHNNGQFVAADTSILPFGTKLVIPGYANAPVEVLDRGGAIKGNKLDVFFPTHEEARQWGRRWVEVIVSPG